MLVFLTYMHQTLPTLGNRKEQQQIKSYEKPFVKLIFSQGTKNLKIIYFTHQTFFFNQDSLHARQNSHYEAWNYKKKKHKKITAYWKSVWKEPTVKRSLLILYFKPIRSQVKGKQSIGREFHILAVRGKKLLTQTSL